MATTLARRLVFDALNNGAHDTATKGRDPITPTRVRNLGSYGRRNTFKEKLR
jgi:hypothetical protein